MTNEMYEDLLERNKLQISELNTLTEEQDKHIVELEKEIAELKGEADDILDNWCRGDDPCPHLKKRDEQLTKAKEIIKDLLQCLPKENIEGIYEITEEAEEFFKRCGN